MAPILKQVKDAVGDTATISKVNVDKSPGAARSYPVQGVPTLIIFKNGEIVWRQSGVQQAKNLVSLINKFK